MMSPHEQAIASLCNWQVNMLKFDQAAQSLMESYYFTLAAFRAVKQKGFSYKAALHTLVRSQVLET